MGGGAKVLAATQPNPTTPASSRFGRELVGLNLSVSVFNFGVSVGNALSSFSKCGTLKVRHQEFPGIETLLLYHFVNFNGS